MGDCEMTRQDEHEWAHHDTLAIARGDDDWHVVLSTDPEFGCVQFERRS